MRLQYKNKKSSVEYDGRGKLAVKHIGHGNSFIAQKY